MKIKPLFIQLGVDFASVDSSIMFYDSEILRTKHVSLMDKEIDLFMEQYNAKNDWSVFFKVMLMEYCKSKNSNQLFVVKYREELIENLLYINSLPDIQKKYKNGYLHNVFIQSYEKGMAGMLEISNYFGYINFS